MPLFGKKRIHELELENDRLRADLVALRNQIEYLIRTIRQTDDIIFSISQCTNWESMRPRVATLTDQMTQRKVSESNRINGLIRSELHETYKPPTNLKQIGNK